MAEDRELLHYGVKGMRWGRRRDRSPVSVTTTQTPGQRVIAKGGENQKAHPDAVAAAKNRRTAKASTTDALSTKDLQQLVQRMNLEQQYSRLTTPQKSKGKQFIDRLFKNPQDREKTIKTVSNANRTLGDILSAGSAATRADLSGIGS